MKQIHSILLFISVSSLLFISVSCKKDNQTPTIVFIEPDTNLLITKDTILTIIVEPFDNDGEIIKVELLINNDLIKTFDSPPYQYDWEECKLENEGEYIIKAIAYDDDGASVMTEKSVEIYDYRTKYTGSFNFEIITISYVISEPAHYDTSYYNGTISKYELIDSESDTYNGDDSNENPEEKITIRCNSYLMVTSVITETGELVTRYGYHYNQYGSFTDINTMFVNFDGASAMGGGTTYKVKGIRIIQ